MAGFNEYPYRDYSGYNLDWIIERIKGVEVLDDTAQKALDKAENAQATADGVSGIAQQALTTANTAAQTAESAQATANSVSDSAQQALTTANTAAQTADSARTAAANAQATADGVSGIAQQALTTANTAAQTADSARTTAENAQATADGIAGTAQQALTTANTAAQTAGNAQTTADSAQADIDNIIDNYNSHYTYQNASAVNVPNGGDWTKITTFTPNPGLYLIVAGVQWAAGAAGSRGIAITTASSVSAAGPGRNSAMVPGASGSVTRVQHINILNIADGDSINVYCWQNSGAALQALVYTHYVKLK